MGGEVNKTETKGVVTDNKGVSFSNLSILQIKCWMV